MKDISIEVKRVEVSKVLLNENKIGYKIYFKSNDLMKNIYVEFPLQNSEEIAKVVLSKIKSSEDITVDDSYDILQSIVLLKIVNQEEVEQEIAEFFTKFIGRVRSFKSKKTSDNYIDNYNQLLKERIEL
ncbi:hypothetical protein HYX15_03120 [Candidatus Woesearchaeota archaeon]|nr:hypothetical protein [Candidatus Woesearchaeota archaeon]